MSKNEQNSQVFTNTYVLHVLPLCVSIRGNVYLVSHDVSVYDRVSCLSSYQCMPYIVHMLYYSITSSCTRDVYTDL